MSFNAHRHIPNENAILYYPTELRIKLPDRIAADTPHPGPPGEEYERKAGTVFKRRSSTLRQKKILPQTPDNGMNGSAKARKNFYIYLQPLEEHTR
jgi:hypothetical protein